ncbi:MAG: type II secretion system protein, partial [Lachnospiraceae bacterium]|nr:type II secretion system protein [Lachnospiraceae bacterium]
MAELLMVVAIISILSAVAFIAIIQHQRGLRQKEMDSEAEIIYVAAQNQLSKLKAAGSQGVYISTSDTKSGFAGTATDVYSMSAPSDWAPSLDTIESGSTDANFWYITDSTKETEGSAASFIMSRSAVEDTIWSNHWIIEYDPAACSVYAVYYWERELEEDLSNETVRDPYRDRDYRLEKNGYVGYYGGDITSGASTTKGLPEITVDNGERLTALIQFVLNQETIGNVTFNIHIRDQHGHDRLITSTQLTPGEYYLKNIGKRYYLELVLDDLSSESKRFYNKYGAGNTTIPESQRLSSGDDLNISVSVSCEGDYNFEEKTVEYPYKVNSLYANDSEFESGGDKLKTANISYVRHLQNLDASSYPAAVLSDPGKYIKPENALQISDISFYDDPYDDKDWYSLYHSSYFYTVGGNVSFATIRNPYLSGYEGMTTEGAVKLYHTISGLSVTAPAGGQAALFGVVASPATL